MANNKVRLTSERIQVSESIEAVYELVCERGWGDGLPVIPATEERVQRMLDYIGRDPDELVGRVSPQGGKATIEKIAINAVLAGCLPEYLPVIVAAVEAMVEPEFNLFSLQHTTNPVAPLAIINGPIRKQLNINCRWNCLGQGWRANATIGRAIRFILINIGGGIPEAIDKAVHGMPGKYTFCFGEDEEDSPWDSLSIERGFDKQISTVTMVGVHGTHNVATVTPNCQGWPKLIANSMVTLGNNNMWFPKGGEPVVVLGPGQASEFARVGLSKADVKKRIFEYAWVDESEITAEMRARAPTEFLIVEDKVFPCERAEDIMIVVAGGSVTHHAVVMPTFGSQTKAVTKPIVTKSGS